MTIAVTVGKAVPEEADWWVAHPYIAVPAHTSFNDKPGVEPFGAMRWTGFNDDNGGRT